jgi:hypothetical protein
MAAYLYHSAVTVKTSPLLEDIEHNKTKLSSLWLGDGANILATNLQVC